MKRFFIYRRYMVLLWMSLTILVPATRGAGSVQLSATVDKSVVHVGDVFHLSINITSPPDTRILFPSKTPDLSPFEVLEQRFETKPGETPGTSVDIWELSISSYRTGDAEIPSIHIEYRNPDGSTGHLTTEPITIRTESLLNEKQSEPRPLKGPVSAAARLRYKIYVLLGIAVFVSLITGILLWIKRRRLRKKNLPPPPSPPQPAHIIALSALTALKNSNYLSSGDIKTFFIELSRILKTYLEQRFAFPAIERTTGEIKNNMKAIPISFEQSRLLIEILELSDLVKFAKYRPDPASCYNALERTERLINETKESPLSHTDASSVSSDNQKGTPPLTPSAMKQVETPSGETG